ncbi:MFS transporter [Rhodobacteraceae bacterium NNCM2]|nr:MFS transporter [Coraliihabitans acroporae]
MSGIAKFALLVVVFVDLIGQGLVFPILNALIMEPSAPLLPHDTTETNRHLTYGLVIGIFFLCWFVGAPYIAKLSDVIGRKNAILICLFGALAGYGITIVALYTQSLFLLILGRGITGLTAGNQPIAQAAMVDGSRDEQDCNRNMGLLMIGVSAGLVGGPLIGGLLSDPAVLGAEASFKLPFYASFAIVLAAILLVVFFFHDQKDERSPFVFRPLEIFETLWQTTRYPLVMRLTAVLILFHIANLSFYIFIDNYMTSRFGYGTLGSSMVMLTIGVAIACSSSFLVVPAQARFSKYTIIATTLVVFILGSLMVIYAPSGIWCFPAIFLIYFTFGVTYPTFLGLYSASVDETQQGWVMGITVAVFTLIAGIVSLLGGDLIAIDLTLPFWVVIGAAICALVAQALVWRVPQIERMTARPAKRG